MKHEKKQDPMFQLIVKFVSLYIVSMLFTWTIYATLYPHMIAASMSLDTIFNSLCVLLSWHFCHDGYFKFCFLCVRLSKLCEKCYIHQIGNVNEHLVKASKNNFRKKVNLELSRSQMDEPSWVSMPPTTHLNPNVVSSQSGHDTNREKKRGRERDRNRDRESNTVQRKEASNPIQPPPKNKISLGNSNVNSKDNSNENKTNMKSKEDMDYTPFQSPPMDALSSSIGLNPSAFKQQKSFQSQLSSQPGSSVFSGPEDPVPTSDVDDNPYNIRNKKNRSTKNKNKIPSSYIINVNHPYATKHLSRKAPELAMVPSVSNASVTGKPFHYTPRRFISNSAGCSDDGELDDDEDEIDIPDEIREISPSPAPTRLLRLGNSARLSSFENDSSNEPVMMGETNSKGIGRNINVGAKKTIAHARSRFKKRKEKRFMDMDELMNGISNITDEDRLTYHNSRMSPRKRNDKRNKHTNININVDGDDANLPKIVENGEHNGNFILTEPPPNASMSKKRKNSNSRNTERSTSKKYKTLAQKVKESLHHVTQVVEVGFYDENDNGGQSSRSPSTKNGEDDIDIDIDGDGSGNSGANSGANSGDMTPTPQPNVSKQNSNKRKNDNEDNDGIIRKVDTFDLVEFETLIRQVKLNGAKKGNLNSVAARSDINSIHTAFTELEEKLDQPIRGDHEMQNIDSLVTLQNIQKKQNNRMKQRMLNRNRINGINNLQNIDDDIENRPNGQQEELTLSGLIPRIPSRDIVDGGHGRQTSADLLQIISGDKESTADVVHPRFDRIPSGDTINTLNTIGTEITQVTNTTDLYNGVGRNTIGNTSVNTMASYNMNSININGNNNNNNNNMNNKNVNDYKTVASESVMPSNRSSVNTVTTITTINTIGAPKIGGIFQNSMSRKIKSGNQSDNTNKNNNNNNNNNNTTARGTGKSVYFSDSIDESKNSNDQSNDSSSHDNQNSGNTNGNMKREHGIKSFAPHTSQNDNNLILTGIEDVDKYSTNLNMNNHDDDNDSRNLSSSPMGGTPNLNYDDDNNEQRAYISDDTSFPELGHEQKDHIVRGTSMVSDATNFGTDDDTDYGNGTNISVNGSVNGSINGIQTDNDNEDRHNLLKPPARAPNK